MSVTIKKLVAEPSWISPSQIQRGNAYEDFDGDIYIGNAAPVRAQRQISAFSLCGNYVIYKDDPIKVREIDLEIHVK